jgi:hypothetical protein
MNMLDPGSYIIGIGVNILPGPPTMKKKFLL